MDHSDYLYYFWILDYFWITRIISRLFISCIIWDYSNQLWTTRFILDHSYQFLDHYFWIIHIIAASLFQDQLYYLRWRNYLPIGYDGYVYGYGKAESESNYPWVIFTQYN
jgi:hypothetical protein